MQLVAFRFSCAANPVIGRSRTLRLQLIALAFAAAATIVSGQVSAAPSSDAIDVFKAGTEGFYTFRIPVLIFSNPAHPPIPDSDKGRRRMTVRLNFDGGERWTAGKLLHEGSASYSSLTALPDGTVLCLFEGGREHRREWIRLARFPFAELLPWK